ncbi:hypothetical protein SV7mr_07930 [Stieleria bergensis]|uniref:Flagellar biosynthesis protein, FliO n=1 Tax=Stieleria bergensis TaxID=2528025 RepID=A0A517SQA8_9BACT|nr:hypothetical protein SV7mr_07930 [Planctomycetes bacterium SV_7m_r]
MVNSCLFKPWQSRTRRIDRGYKQALNWQLATALTVLMTACMLDGVINRADAQSVPRSSQYNYPGSQSVSSQPVSSQPMSVYTAPRSQVPRSQAPRSQAPRSQAPRSQASNSQASATRLASTAPALASTAVYPVVGDRQPSPHHFASLSQPPASAARLDGASLEEAALKQSTARETSSKATAELAETQANRGQANRGQASATDGFPDLMPSDQAEQTNTSFVDGLLEGDFAAGPMVRTGSALLIVLSVFIGLIYCYRKLGSKGVVPGRLPTDLVQHLGSTVIDQGMRVSFIQMADRIVVVGQRANGDPVTLTEITDPVKIQQVVNRCMGRPQIVGQRDHGSVPHQQSISSSLEMAIR